MARPSLRFTICTFLVGLSTICQAQPHLELAYSEVNPDWKPYANGSGLRVLGKLSLPKSLYLFGSYNTASLQTSGPELSRYKEATDWRIIGTGWAYPINESLRLQSGVSYQGVDVQGGYQDGWAFHTGLKLTPLNWMFFELDLAYLDLLVQDISLEATLGIRLIDHAAITFRIHDHSDWDFTAYEAGVRLFF